MEYKMEKNAQKTNWLIDAALFIGLLLSFWLDLTGVGWHQWLGVGLGALITYHFLVHWKWVEVTGHRLFGRMARQPRLYFAIDAALLAGFYLVGLTGLVISTWLGLELGNYAAWRELHVWTSIAALALVVLKIGLHQGWIIRTARRYLPRRSPARSIPGLEQTQLVAVRTSPVAAPLQSGRRDFLLLMGVVGTAALVSTLGVLVEPAAGVDTAAGDGESLPSAVETTSQASAQSNSSSSSACSAMCPKGCSYPGHCKRYQDSNGNGRCDLGECA
jgi:hypothetical protein